MLWIRDRHHVMQRDVHYQQPTTGRAGFCVPVFTLVKYPQLRDCTNQFPTRYATSRAHRQREGVRVCNLDLFGNTHNLLHVTKNRVLVVVEAFLRMLLHTYLAKPYEWQEVLYIVTRWRFCCSYSDYGELHALPPSLRLCALDYMYNM